ncbi:MAG: N-glycosylase/DNA lyase [Elusimicrobiota bacterium]
MNDIKQIYKTKKQEIDSRLRGFKKAGDSQDKIIFAELCFCILTPQSKALSADKAIKKLTANFFLYTGSNKEISKHLRGVRFMNNKASYITQTRRKLMKGDRFFIKEFLNEKDVFRLREKLAGEVKGFGFKESSHFLRNIGRGNNIAILDRHIIKKLKKYAVINEIPKTISKKKYIEIENKMRKFSKQVNIPMDAMDMVFWYMETGYFFK